MTSWVIMLSVSCFFGPGLLKYLFDVNETIYGEADISLVRNLKSSIRAKRF